MRYMRYIGELSQGEWKGELTWTMGFRARLEVVAEPREWMRPLGESEQRKPHS